MGKIFLAVIILICICLTIALLQSREELFGLYNELPDNDADLNSLDEELDKNTDEYEGSSDWIVFKEDGLCGYMDKNQEIKIPPQFDGAYPFSEGLASVYMHNRLPDSDTDSWFGFIDTSGEFVIQAFTTGRAVLVKALQW